MNENAYFILDPKELPALTEPSDGRVTPYDAGIPLFDSSDSMLNEIYFYRFDSYTRHIEMTPKGYVITEFLPQVGWAGKYNTICCAAGHHFYEGRWLHDRSFLDSYADWWYCGEAAPRLYSCWIADSILRRAEVTGDASPALALLPKMIENYESWVRTNYRPEHGLFWQIDDRDGMECSGSGNGLRPTINSYMYSELRTFATLCELAGSHRLSEEYAERAGELRRRINDRLWDSELGFYVNLSDEMNAASCKMREEIGFIPWYFNIPETAGEAAWAQLFDREGFLAEYGPTTLERRSERFMAPYDHSCLWNGPSWPYATSQTLTAMANLLNNYTQSTVTKSDFLRLLRTYARSHYITDENKRTVPWIDENLDPDTGEWLARAYVARCNDQPRGMYYNHSSFCDIVISGLVGIRPSLGSELVINPLAGESDLEFFCLDGVLYHSRYITVLWDRTGERYGRGAGLRVFENGREVAFSEKLSRVSITLK